ncbi:hypothetical protein [Gilliamella sp. Occ4-3]|uniref:hypothetical protein n=1 Tax=Gilliamella sp. Occ4-3 TaxID=3120254 RepID=UPI00080DDE0E|nr:hypothetical protein [Gilliamella apicola]OCG79535.1 hypothetical protein A9G44_11240 [Gilliamella apicola]
MKYYAKLVAIDPYIEEQATFDFGQYQLCCFINSSACALNQGNIYLLELNLCFIDKIKPELSGDKHFSIMQQADTFVHHINGYLFENRLILSNLVFQDDLFYDFAYLSGNFIKFSVDRLSIDILNNIF